MQETLFSQIKSEFLPLLFLTALREESRALLETAPFEKSSLSGRLPVYQLRRQPVFLTAVGMGVRWDESDFRRLMAHIRPALAVNYGFAGALDPAVPPFRRFRISAVHAPEKPPIQMPWAGAFGISGLPATELLTLPEAVLKAAERDRLYREYRIPLVDMETYRLAEWLRNGPGRFVALKLVSDAANEESAGHIRQHLPRLRAGLLAMVNDFLLLLK